MSLRPPPDGPCACTGVRWCARCLDPEVRRARKMDDPVPRPPILDGPDVHVFDLDRQTAPGRPDFEGLFVIRDALSADEADALLSEIERTPLQPSQSGKAKRHVGPRINFNKRRMNADGFAGLPAWAFDLDARIRARVAAPETGVPAVTRAALAAHRTTDVFVLRYWPEEASNLDFHVDDVFAYGELILDVSLECDTWLTFVRGRDGSEVAPDPHADEPPACVRCPLPARSVAILHGPARHRWEHAVLANDVPARRTSVTLRSLGASLRDTPEGRRVLERAQSPLPSTAESAASRASKTS